MKAIQIRYIPATNTKDYRLKAFAEGGQSVTIARSSIDHELSEEEQRIFVAKFLMRKLGWDAYSMITGHGILPCGDYVVTTGSKK
jgi:hypothetical protein